MLGGTGLPSSVAGAVCGFGALAHEAGLESIDEVPNALARLRRTVVRVVGCTGLCIGPALWLPPGYVR